MNCRSNIDCDTDVEKTNHSALLSRSQCVCPTLFCLSSYLSVLSCLLAWLLFTCLSSSPIVFLCFFVSSFCLSRLLFVSVPTCLSACLSVSLLVFPPVCLTFIYLFIYCLSGIQCWSEACLPSFTVKYSADWKGHFSNGAALPLIFCLSLGVRLIYHASSPADIQIHFDWRLDGMTPTTTNTANITQMHEHTHRQIWCSAYSQSDIQWIWICLLRQHIPTYI